MDNIQTQSGEPTAETVIDANASSQAQAAPVQVTTPASDIPTPHHTHNIHEPSLAAKLAHTKWEGAEIILHDLSLFAQKLRRDKQVASPATLLNEVANLRKKYSHFFLKGV